MRRRSAAVSALTAACAAAIGLAACSSGSSSSTAATSPGAATDTTPVTITMWSGYTDRELGILGSVLNAFHTKYPWITVKNVGGVDDDKIVKSIRGGNAPDVALSFSADSLGAYCSSGAWINLGPYISRDHLDLRQIPAPSLGYSNYNGTRCALPALADVYGLYYNTKLLQAAGYTQPPKTATELLDMAVKLTTYNPDGSIKVAGFVPLWGFYEMVAAHVGPNWGVSWTTPEGKSALSTDPHWTAMLTWQKKFVDAIGYDKLRRFTSGAGDTEFAETNLFETGRLAMNLDGEYRTAFIKSEHPELSFATAPFPVDDAQPDLYGAGYTTGNVVGIPRTTTGHQREAAWTLVKWLSTDPVAQVSLANGLRNVPTLTPALSDPRLTGDQNFAVFLKIYANPGTASTPITAAGSANQDLLGSFLDKYQAGSVQNLQAGLKVTDAQINAQLANSGGGAP